MSLLNYKGYTGSVEFSQEDNCLYGKVLGMKKDCISYEGETVSELLSDFERAVDEYLSSCKPRGVKPAKPYSGRLVFRMPSDLHSRVAATAAGLGMTINGFSNTAILDELSKYR